MSDAQTPESREGLMDTCSRMQLHTGLDDPSWKEKFGNEKGLYGFVTAAVQQSNRELLLRLKKQAGTYFTESDGTFDYIPVETIDAELAALGRQQAGEEPTDV